MNIKGLLLIQFCLQRLQHRTKMTNLTDTQKHDFTQYPNIGIIKNNNNYILFCTTARFSKTLPKLSSPSHHQSPETYVKLVYYPLNAVLSLFSH